MNLSELEEKINYLIDNKRPEKELYSLLAENSIEGNIDIVILRIIDNFLLTTSKCRYLISNISILSSHIDMIKKVITYEGKLQTPIFIQKILDIYNVILSEDEVTYLIKYSEDCEFNFDINLKNVKEYLEYYKTSRNYAKKPYWVTRKTGENASLLETVSTESPLAKLYEGDKVKNIVKENSSLIKSLSIGNKNIENVEEAISCFLSTLSKTQNFREIDEPSRVFGPANSFRNRQCSSQPGPCRMLECSCLLDEEEGEVDWFTGNCEQCNNIIIDRSHCVRYPKEFGGWEGCFCCIQCIIDKYNIDEDNDVENLDQSMFRLQLLENSLKRNGIMDRH